MVSGADDLVLKGWVKSNRKKTAGDATLQKQQGK
jgi:hypothetical protein